MCVDVVVMVLVHRAGYRYDAVYRYEFLDNGYWVQAPPSPPSKKYRTPTNGTFFFFLEAKAIEHHHKTP
jgi:hypothetical protein